MVIQSHTRRSRGAVRTGAVLLGPPPVVVASVRHWTRKQVRGHRPFAVKGASLYGVIDATSGDEIIFRKLRHFAGVAICGAEAKHGTTIGVSKTTALARVADPTHEFAYTVPAAAASTTCFWQVRTCEADVECETNALPSRTAIDATLDETPEMFGSAVLLSQEQRSGGVVRLRFAYRASLQGLHRAGRGR